MAKNKGLNDGRPIEEDSIRQEESEDDLTDELSEEDADDEEDVTGDPDTGVPAAAFKLFQLRSTAMHSPLIWELLAKWDDDQPFIGYRSPGALMNDHYRHDSLKDLVGDMYQRIGGDPAQPHPSKPTDEATTTQRTD